jgi:hypothetical protein
VKVIDVTLTEYTEDIAAATEEATKKTETVLQKRTINRN